MCPQASNTAQKNISKNVGAPPDEQASIFLLPHLSNKNKVAKKDTVILQHKAYYILWVYISMFLKAKMLNFLASFQQDQL